MIDNPTPEPAAAPKTLSTAHILGAPITTILGIGQTVIASLLAMPGGVLPTNAVGWVTLGVSMLPAILGALAK